MASRMQKDKTGIAWPAAVQMLPEAKAKVDATLTKFAKMVNMKGI
jgi:predicted 3-demethylubiquinone-9 3-methyltransferase (glyoxalase superfamily)